MEDGKGKTEYQAGQKIVYRRDNKLKGYGEIESIWEGKAIITRMDKGFSRYLTASNEAIELKQIIRSY